jgi:hypothetical protein
MLIIAYTLLKNRQSCPDLGGTHLEQINKDQLQKYLVKGLHRLGLKATVEPVPAPARESIFEGETRQAQTTGREQTRGYH